MSIDPARMAQLLTDEQIAEFRSHIDTSVGPEGHWPRNGPTTSGGVPLWRVRVKVGGGRRFW
jgi:hypothetical protein